MQNGSLPGWKWGLYAELETATLIVCCLWAIVSCSFQFACIYYYRATAAYGWFSVGSDQVLRICMHACIFDPLNPLICSQIGWGWYLSPQVFETIMKNCGESVHQQVAEKDVLREMVKIVKKKVSLVGIAWALKYFQFSSPQWELRLLISLLGH